MTAVTYRLRQWRAILAIYIQDGLAYRASGVIWVLSDAVSAIFMPLVMSSAAAGGLIQGFDGKSFTLYYLLSLLVTSFVTCHFMWEVAYEIKEGIFSTYLMRPMGFLEFMSMRNLAWRLVRTLIFLPMFGIFLFAYRDALSGLQVYLGWEVFVAIILAHFVSFMFVMALATVALFVQEATSIFEIYYIPMLFLSGQMFPVSLFPEWARNLALWMPFYYTTGFPTELMMGRISPSQALPIIGIQVLWILVSYAAFRVLYQQGLKQYTGVGM